MILVTGGTGYIGSHTSVELLQAGYDVLIADNLSNSNEEIAYRIAEITGKTPYFEKVDFQNLNQVETLFKKYPEINSVIHFAALKAVGESVQEPLKYYYNNLACLLNLIKVMKENNVKNIVFSSSSTVYGQPEKLPVDESSPIVEANSPYGNTKKIAEEILSDECKIDKDFNVCLLRYFNPIGAHKSGIIGELPQGIPNNLMPYITQTAFGIREQLSVYGNDYNTPDGTCIRDYIDVVDLAKAHVVAIKRLLQKENAENLEFYNLGTGKGLSVLEIIHAFENATGVKLNYKIVDRRPGDIEQVWADNTKAKNILKWEAKTHIEETLSNSWNWEKNYRKNKIK